MAPNQPVIDPTANVLALVKAANESFDALLKLHIQRQDDLAKQREANHHELHKLERHWVERLLLEKDKRYDERRITQLESSAKEFMALNKVVDGFKTDYKYYHDSLVNRVTMLEQNQFRGAGQSEQSKEGRQVNQWVIGILLVIILSVVEHFWK